MLRSGRRPTHRHRRVPGAAMARCPASARGRSATRSRRRGGCAPVSRVGGGEDRSGRDRGGRRGGGGRGDGAGAQARQRGARARSSADGATPVRRRRAAVRVPAGRGAGDAHDRDPTPSGGPLGAGPRLGRRTRGSARVVSPLPRRLVVPRPRERLRAAARGRAEPGARRHRLALRGLPVRRTGLRSDGAHYGRRSPADRGRISRRAPRAVRPCGERSERRGREPARGRAARGAAPAVRGPAAGCPAARRQSPDHDTRGSGQRLGLGARRARRGRHHRRPGDPGGAKRDGPGRARVARHGASMRRRAGGAHMTLDAVGLEVMGHAFASIAEEMGLVLIHSAVSPNIRERRDCSAALFDAAGEMIAQAAHIPVHLGAMHEAVAAVRALAPPPGPGDVFILNDPYTGGSHLPDITLIGAVEVDGTVGGYSVVRAHHSDVGGVQAGSMPAGAREVFAEGVIVPPLRLTADVERFLLANVRTAETRRADLAAQRAAVARGGEGLRALAARYGWAAVRGAATDLLDYAERRARDALGRLTATALTATDWLEGDGVDDADLALSVRVDITEGVFHVDFTGTAPAARGNVNCPLAVTRSAVLFVVRTLLPDDVPTNGGVQRAVRVTAPPGCLVNARFPSAVAAGNVETSQRIADTVFLALAAGGISVPAQGQGTMNNVTFGGQLATGNVQRGDGVVGGWTYYETIGGGQGASQGAPGPAGVHVGMSNTRNTPIEVLEMEYPLRLKSYSLRRGSGGVGQWRGGDGVVREFEALAPMEASILAERRRHAPRGAAGGRDGARGRPPLNGLPLAPEL